MATGERVWSSQGKTATKYESTPLPSGDWSMKLRGDMVAIGKANKPGAFSYVTCPFEVLDSGTDGGKNRIMYHMFFCSLKNGKDGKPMAERADQIVGFLRAVGEEIDFGITDQPDEKGQPTPVLNPTQIANWLKQRDGVVVQAHTKIEKGKDGYPAKGKIDYFSEAEQQAEGGGGEYQGIDEGGVDEDGGIEAQSAEYETEALPPQTRNGTPPAHVLAKKQQTQVRTQPAPAKRR